MKPSLLSSLILATVTAGTLNTAKASDPHNRAGQHPGHRNGLLQQIVPALISGAYGNPQPRYDQPAPCNYRPAPSCPAPPKKYKHRPNAWKIVGGQFPRGRKIPQGWHSIGWFQSHGFDVNRLFLVNEDGQYYGGRGPSSCASRGQSGCGGQSGRAPHPAGPSQGGSRGACAGASHPWGGGYAGHPGAYSR